MKIATVIVTCNRRDMLSVLLKDLLNQSRKSDTIIVIDNGSEDGTADLVKERFPSVSLIELKQNIGLFGGLEIGINDAIQKGYEAVWLVDDDARPREDALERLLDVICSDNSLRDSVIWCANLAPESQIFTEPVGVKIDGKWEIYHELLPELQDKVYETSGGPNIGIYIPCSVIEKVGPPRGDTVFNGEQEFTYRLQRGGVKLYRCFSSIIYHKRQEFSEINFMGRTRHVNIKVQPWATYYEFRNRIYTDLTYKRRSVVRSLLNTALDSVIKVYMSEKKISTLVHISRAVYDGLFGKMGMRVQIPRPKQ